MIRWFTGMESWNGQKNIRQFSTSFIFERVNIPFHLIVHTGRQREMDFSSLFFSLAAQPSIFPCSFCLNHIQLFFKGFPRFFPSEIIFTTSWCHSMLCDVIFSCLMQKSLKLLPDNDWEQENWNDKSFRTLQREQRDMQKKNSLVGNYSKNLFISNEAGRGWQ